MPALPSSPETFEPLPPGSELRDTETAKSIFYSTSSLLWLNRSIRFQCYEMSCIRSVSVFKSKSGLTTLNEHTSLLTLRDKLE